MEQIQQVQHHTNQRTTTINLLLSMVVRNEAHRFLRDVLKSVMDYVDYVLIIDDASTDDTVLVCKEVLEEFPHQIIENEQSLFSNEVELRRLQWDASAKLNPQWILNLDADEIFEEKIAICLPELLSGDYDTINFRLYDMWNETDYRSDGLWYAHEIYRPFIVRYKPELAYSFPEMAQHCGRFPVQIYHFSGKKSDIRLKHLGWSKEVERQHKYNRYLKLDPDGRFGSKEQYESILDNNPNLIPFLLTKRVLVGSPVHQKPPMLRDFLHSLTKLNKTNLDVHYLFIDDNEDEISKGILADFQAGNQNVTILPNTEPAIYNEKSHHWRDEVTVKVGKNKDKIFDFARGHNFDFVFLADSDLVLHPMTLVHLVELNKEVVSEVFYTAWTEGGTVMPQVWLYDSYKFSENGTPNQENENYWKFSDLLQTPGVYPVGGLGACTMISKSALDKGVSFARLYNLTFWGEDRHFCIRAAALGIQLYASTYYPAFHIYRDQNLEKVALFWDEVEKGNQQAGRV